jgi:thymidine kinase
MKQPQLVLCCGGMFSGKTTKALYYIDRFQYQNKKIASFKPIGDNRYSDTEIVSHAGWRIPATPISTGDDIKQWLDNNMPDADVVFLDEMFMVPGSAKTLVDLYFSGKTVVISTLDLSSDLTILPEVANILPYASIVHKTLSVCSICGEDARFSYSKFKKDKEILIGGKDKYEARCFNHKGTIS